MSLPTTPTTYGDCYEVLDKAAAEPKGIRVKVPDYDSAMFFRMRLHQARKIVRKQNKDIYEADHPMHNASPYDELVIRNPRRVNDDFWLYIEKYQSIPDNLVQSLSDIDDDYEEVQMQHKQIETDNHIVPINHIVQRMLRR